MNVVTFVGELLLVV